MTPWTIHQQGPDESRYIIDEATGRFIARMDTEASDEQWRLAAAAPEMAKVLTDLAVAAARIVEDDAHPTIVHVTELNRRRRRACKLISRQFFADSTGRNFFPERNRTMSAERDPDAKLREAIAALKQYRADVAAGKRPPDEAHERRLIRAYRRLVENGC